MNLRTAGGVRALLAFTVATAAFLTLSLLLTGFSEAKTVQGKVLSGERGLAGLKVTLHKTVAGRSGSKSIGGDKTSRNGAFRISFKAPSASKAVLYLTARKPRPPFRQHRKGSPASFNEPQDRRPGPVRLAASLGSAPFAGQVTLNERTTVATGFAFAQFVKGPAGISGSSPGVQNATLMARNLARFRNGAISDVLDREPNAGQTETRRKFNALANLLVPCARNQNQCSDLADLARAKGEATPSGALESIAMIAANPWSKASAILEAIRSGPAPYEPTLKSSDSPDNWGLFLRFFGDGKSLDGPGNIAIDAEGALWVNNNYVYDPDQQAVTCGSDLLFKFNPDGRFAEGSPFQGGGLGGAGYGITLDPKGRVWVGNFGFSGRGCADPPPANSVSRFSAAGKPANANGFTAGDIDWPQGTVSDRRGKIWIGNCASDSVTTYGNGKPANARNLTGLGISKPFGVTVGRNGLVFVAGNNSSSVAVLNPDGTPLPGSPVSGGGIKRPMGLASDIQGNMWVANSGVVDPPCPGDPIRPPISKGGSITLIGADGKLKSDTGFTGGGMTIPWGIAVDGDNTVWVANFGDQRVSQFCGTSPGRCPGDRRTGQPISPNKTGYGFDGLARNTAAQIDPTGNVWLTNNWQNRPYLSNPGGTEIVAMVGAAAPLKTPLIGPPRRP